MKRWLPMALVSLGLVLPGCARQGATGANAADTTAAARGSGSAGSIEQVYDPGSGAANGSGNSSRWSIPVPFGVKAADEAEAQSEISFEAIVPPSSLGTPTSIVVGDPTTVPVGDRVIGWTFDSPAVFDVTEATTGMSGMTESELEGLATCDASETGCDTTGWSLVQLRSGATALLIDPAKTKLPSSATSVMWLSSGVVIRVIGPAESLTADQALAIANSF